MMDRRGIHFYDVSMRKVQVRFTEPQLCQPRDVAPREDMPVSQIIRRATEEYLARIPPARAARGRSAIPVFNGGRTLIRPGRYRDLVYRDRAGSGE